MLLLQPRLRLQLPQLALVEAINRQAQVGAGCGHGLQASPRSSWLPASMSCSRWVGADLCTCCHEVCRRADMCAVPLQGLSTAAALETEQSRAAVLTVQEAAVPQLLAMLAALGPIPRWRSANSPTVQPPGEAGPSMAEPVQALVPRCPLHQPYEGYRSGLVQGAAGCKAAALPAAAGA